MKLLLIIIMLCVSSIGKSQTSETAIPPAFEGFPVKEIIKKLNADKIEFDLQNEDGIFKARNRKTHKWGMFQKSDDEKIKLKELIPMQYDSINFFSIENGFTPVYNNGKVGFYLSPLSYPKAKQTIPCKFDDFQKYELESKNYLAVKKDEKWALVDWKTGEEITDFIYDNKQDLPKITSSFEDFPIKAMAKKLNADKIEFDLQNEDGVFKARNKITKKWGLFQDFSDKKIDVKEFIPMQYDSLRFFSFNGLFTAVYNNGKAGFYLSPWSYETKAKQTVPCRYDEYHKFLYSDKDQIFLAVKRDGKWGWVDWLTGEEKSEFIYNDKKELPKPSWDQRSSLNE